MFEDEIRCPNFGGKALCTILPAPSSVHSGKTFVGCKTGALQSTTASIWCVMVLANEEIKTDKSACCFPDDLFAKRAPWGQRKDTIQTFLYDVNTLLFVNITKEMRLLPRKMLHITRLLRLSVDWTRFIDKTNPENSENN